jgi:sugar lactone lactonase YvrE
MGQTMTGRPLSLVAALGALALVACNRGDSAGRNDSGATADSAAASRAPADTVSRSALATMIRSVPGLDIPESVRHDSNQDVYFVSNVGQGATAKDNNGYISRIYLDGRPPAVRFIAGGFKSVMLHAPKGLAIRGETLWVADIDAVRGFNTVTGAPVASIDLSRLGARFLNDVAIAPDGAIYVTDTGLHFAPDGAVTHPGPDRVFRVGPDRAPSIALEGAPLELPNGITWDAAQNRFLIVGFGGRREILAWRPGGPAPTVIATSSAGGPSDFDGIEPWRNGLFLIASQGDSSVHSFDGTNFTRVASGLPNVGDIGIDRLRNLLLAPLLENARVEPVPLPRAP